MNFMKYVFLIGAIICGALAMMAVLMSSGEGASSIWSWAAWLLYIPAFYLLNFIFEDYGIGSGYTLWAGGTVVLVALFVAVYGPSWGETLNVWQYGSLLLVVMGLVGLSLTRPSS